MFSADFISGSRDFTQDLTSGVLILILNYGVCKMRSRVQLKNLSSLLKLGAETASLGIRAHV